MLPAVVTVVVVVMVVSGFVIGWRFATPSTHPWDPTAPIRMLLLGLLVLDGSGAVALAATGESSGGALLIGASFLAIAFGAVGAYRVVVPAMPIERIPTVTRARWPAAAVLAILGLMAYGVIATAHGIPLLTRTPQDTRLAFGGLWFDAFRWLTPPLAVLAIAQAAGRPSRRNLALATTITGIVIALEVLTASRALPFELILAGFLVAWWAGRRLSARGWLALGLAGATLFLGVLFARVGPEGGFRGPLDAATFAVDRTVGRVVLIQPRTIDLVVGVFPDQRPYLGGSTYVRWLAPLTGGERGPSLGSQLFEQLFPDQPPGGFAAPGLLGEGYANFGALGALALMVALGATASLLGLAIRQWPADPATRTLAALLVVAIVRTYATSLNGFLLTAAAAMGWWVVVAAPVGTWASFAVARVWRPRSPDRGQPAATDGLDAEGLTGAPEPRPRAGSEPR